MNIKKYSMALLFLFIILLIGCSNLGGASQTVTEEIPKDVHKDFLYYVETDSDSMDGDLYLKQFGKEEPEKIDSGVINNHFTYAKELNKVFYITEDFTLYEYEVGKEKKKLADHVNHFLIGNDEIPIIYSTDNYDLYVVKNDDEVEKISSNIRQVEVVDHDIYYVNENGHFIKYNIKDRTETEIAPDVSQFMFLNDQLDIAFINQDYFLYYRNAKSEENVRISSGEVYHFDQVQFNGKQLFYVSEDESLYAAEISGDNSPVKIASNVMEFTYLDDQFYYLNCDNNLFSIHVKADDPTRLASDVFDFTISGGKVFYLSNDYNLYKLDEKQNNERLASSVMDYYISADGDIVYRNEEDALFVNDEKVTSEFVNYTYVAGNLVYSTKENKIVLIENLKDEHVIDEDASDYDFAYYYDTLVYSHTLEFPDVAGVWSRDDSEMIIDISNDGILNIVYPYDEVIHLDYDDYGLPRTIMAYTQDDDYMTIRKISDNQIEVSRYGQNITFTKSSKEDVDNQIQQAEEAKDKEAITYVFDGYVRDFARALHYRNLYNVSHYIVPDSNLFAHVEKLVEEADEKNIGIVYDDNYIDAFERQDENTYTITSVEDFIIWENDEEKDVTYRNKYTVKRVNGEFLLSDVQVGYE